MTTDPVLVPGESVPDASDLEYADSTLDVALRDGHARLIDDAERPIGNAAWIQVDRDHFVDDVESLR